jgi:ribosomal protein L37AE/L43A
MAKKDKIWYSLIVVTSKNRGEETMIVCPNCGNKEMQGALYCKECGTQFASASREPTMTIPSRTGSVHMGAGEESIRRFYPRMPAFLFWSIP